MSLHHLARLVAVTLGGLLIAAAVAVPQPAQAYPCVVNSGSVGSFTPCLGPPGTNVTFVLSRSLASAPQQLVFTTGSLTGGAYTGVGVSATLSRSGAGYVAAVPPQLCVAGSGATYQVYLVDAAGIVQGNVGLFVVDCRPGATVPPAATSAPVAAPPLRSAPPATSPVLFPRAAIQIGPFTNGSFERAPSAGGFITLRAGSKDIVGWTVTRASIDLIGTYWRASNGKNSIDLDGTPGPGGIAQTFVTVPRRRYVVSYDLSANPQCAPRIKLMGITAGGSSKRDSFDSNTTSTSAMHYVHHTFIFVATSAKTTLEFRSLDPAGGNCGAVIDNVAVR